MTYVENGLLLKVLIEMRSSYADAVVSFFISFVFCRAQNRVAIFGRSRCVGQNMAFVRNCRKVSPLGSFPVISRHQKDRRFERSMTFVCHLKKLFDQYFDLVINPYLQFLEEFY